MRLPVRTRHLPARIATGLFILNSGLNKREVEEETAAGLHGMAKGAYPFLESVDPKTFARLLSTGEITLGAALLLPVVPTVVAGAGLAAFSTGLLGVYLRTPGMRQEGSLRPSEQGVPMAKDLWMLGIAAGFVVDEIVERACERSH